MINQDIQSRVDAFRGNPDALAQRYQQDQQLIDLLALQKIKSEKEAAARQMQMQMAQQQAKQGQPPTVAEQREQEVLDLTKNEVQQQQNSLRAQQQQQQQEAMQKLLSGIAAAPGAMSAAQPQAMAAGGIVAFQEGGDVSAAEERLRQAQLALRRFGVAQRARDPEGYKAAQQEVQSAREAIMQATAPQAEEAARMGPALAGTTSRGIRGLTPTPAAPAPLPAPLPAAPPTFEDAIRQARGQEFPATAQPERPAPPPPPAPRPAPAAPMATQPPAQPGAVTAGPEMVSPKEIAAAQKMRKEALDQDPNKLRAAEEATAARVYGVPAAYRDLLAKRQSELAASTQVDPSKRFLDRLGILAAAGMQDRGRWYGIGPGATPGLMAYDEAAAKRQADADEAVFNLRKGLMESERTGGIEAYRAGKGAFETSLTQRGKAAGDVSQLQVAQQRALDSALDRQSRERIAQAESAMRREANAINAAGVAESRSARMEQEKNKLSIQISNYEQRIVDAVRKSKEFAPLELLEMQKTNTGKLSPDQQIQYNKLKQSLDLAIQGAQAKANDLRRELGLPTRATPSAPDDKLEGYSLTKVTPSK